MAIGLAFRAFFAVLFRPGAAESVRKALLPVDALEDHKTSAAADRATDRMPIEADSDSISRRTTAAAKRSEALTLLSTLQREARFLDLICEPLDAFEDVQIGAAAREVVRDCQKTLDRLFGIEPLSSNEEGSSCPVPSNPSAVRVRIVGKSSGGAAVGMVMHRGWKATHCQMPTWTGSADDSMVLAPVEIELK